MKAKVSSQLKLAEVLGIHRHTVKAYIEKGIIPSRGPWDSEQARKSIEAWKSEQAKNRESKTGPDGLRAEVVLRQTERIRGRTNGTRQKSERLARRLRKSQAQSPRVDVLRQLVTDWPERMAENIGIILAPTPPNSDTHPAVKSLVAAEERALKRLSNLPGTIIETITQEIEK